MNSDEVSTGGFLRDLPEPSSYYRGIEAPERPRSNNLVTFLRASRKSLQQKNFRNRSHHRHVLMLVLETGGSVIVDGAEHPMQPYQGFLVRPFQFHHYLNLQSDQLRWLFFTFDLERGSEQFDHLSHSILQPGEGDLGLWRDIAARSASNDVRTQREALPLLDTLLYRLTGSFRGTRDVTAKSSRAARAAALIIESVHEGWTVEEIGGKLGLSGRQLRTNFKNEMGISIREYRSNYQFHRAINLLRDSSNSIGSIAELCGFNSQAVFNRFIKRNAGNSPLGLRRSL